MPIFSQTGTIGTSGVARTFWEQDRTGFDDAGIVTLIGGQYDEADGQTPDIVETSNCTLAMDTTNYKIGGSAVQMQMSGAVTATARWAMGSEDSPSTLPPPQAMGIWFYVDSADVGKITYLAIQLFSDAAGTTYWNTGNRLGTVSAGWNFRRFALSGWDDTKIAAVLATLYYVRVTAITNASMNLTIGHVYVECPKKTRLLFVLDACYSSAFAAGGIYEALRARKIPATLATCPGVMGGSLSGDAVISWSELARYASENGNDVSWHSYKGENDVGQSAATVRANAMKAIKTLERHGYHPVWRGAWLGNTATPNHSAIQSLIPAYATAQGTETPEAWPPVNRYDVARFGVHAGSGYDKSGTMSATPNVITMGSGHGIQQGDEIVKVSWSGGSRTGMTVSQVAGNDITVTGGTGDPLPAETTAVTVRSWGIYTRFIDLMFNRYAWYHPFHVIYTHGYDAGAGKLASKHMTPDSLAYVMAKIDAMIRDGTVEFVTMPMMLSRMGLRPGYDWTGYRWIKGIADDGTFWSQGWLP